MANIKTLAEQFVREYKRTPEMGSWETVIELGRSLADAVLNDPTLTKLEPKTAQLAPVTEPLLTPTEPECELLLASKFTQAVSAMCRRTACTNQVARASCKAWIDKRTTHTPDAQEIALVKIGQKIKAIQAMRIRTGCTLQEAKAACDFYDGRVR